MMFGHIYDRISHTLFNTIKSVVIGREAVVCLLLHIYTQSVGKWITVFSYTFIKP